MSHRIDDSADPPYGSETRPPTWRSRLSRAARSRRAQPSDPDDPRAELARARAELDAMRADRAAIERDEALRRTVEALRNELREVRRLAKATDRHVRLVPRELISDIQALQQLLARYAPDARLPPVGGWALSPSGILALVDAIETREATTIVECGSGTSTLWIGYALKRLGRGRAVSLEHLPEYADRTRAIVAAHGLAEFVDVRDAPLSPRQTPRGDFSWYTFDAADLPGPIDVLLVDGPPRSTGEHARYPALPVLADRLAAGALVVADDTERPDETEILEFWLEEEPRLRRTESVGAGVELLTFGG